MVLGIRVTKKHIKEGEGENCHFCPVALAINELLKPGYHCEVGGRVADRIHFFKLLGKDEDNYDTDSLRYLLGVCKMPTKVEKFINRFDRCASFIDTQKLTKEFRPFKFLLILDDYLYEEVVNI